MAKGTVNVGPKKTDTKDFVTKNQVGAANGVAGLDKDKKLPAACVPSHAAADTTYGAGTGSNYGHVKLSDATNGEDGADKGVAATPKAVKAAYDKAAEAAKAAGNVPKASNEKPKANGTAAAGTDATFSRADHVHPRQESDKGITTEGTGEAYTATVEGITALEAGVSFIMLPHTVSTSTTPTLDVNGLGAAQIRRRLGNLATSQEPGYTASWLAAGKPFRVTYDGAYWIVEGMEKPVTADLYGSVAAGKVSAGTFGGQVAANAEGQTPGTSLLRNSKLVSAEEDPTTNGEITWLYE